MRILKYALFGVVGLLVLLVAAIAIFAATFDPNKYKPQIEAAVKEQTGRTLKLQGDLKVAVFPSLGADVGNVTLSELNPAQEFVSLDSAHGSVALLPLLKGEVIVDRIRVSGLKANVIKDKNGKFNFQDLIEGKDKPRPEAKKDEKKGGEAGGAKFDIAGINIDKSSVSYKDLATGQELALTDLTLATGRIGEKADGRLQLGVTARGSKPALNARLDLAGDYKVDLPAKAYALSKVDGSLKGTLDQDTIEAKLTAPKIDIAADKASGEAVTADFRLKGPRRNAELALKIAGIQGSAKALAIPQFTATIALSGPDMPREMKVPLSGSVRADLEKETMNADLTSKFDESNIQAKLGLAKFSPPAYVFDVNVDKLNLDQYFPPKPKAAPTTPEGKAEKKAKPEDTPVDLSPLKELNANGKLQVGALQAQGLKLANVKAEVKAANGRLDVPHSANLYEGSITGALGAQASGNRVTVRESLSGISIGPLLRDFAQQDRLEGKGNVSLDVAGAGATVNTIKKSLDGSAKVNLKDGAVKGIDVAGLLRKVKSLGKSDEGSADSKEKTDFSELNATFQIKDGVAHNKDLDLKAPLIRVNGAGAIDIGNSTMDYTVKAAVVASAKGQGGAGLEQLSGLTVPVKLSGPFDDLKYKVDYGAVAGNLAKSKIGEKVQEGREKVEEKVKDRLKGLIRR
ncbi:MAG TPA: AsmA family protein [Burkholderiales bacterium]|nr:AsmA family protein [Burkholderiales bacterium]